LFRSIFLQDWLQQPVKQISIKPQSSVHTAEVQPKVTSYSSQDSFGPGGDVNASRAGVTV
jgi:hypothetical protein